MGVQLSLEIKSKIIYKDSLYGGKNLKERNE